MTPSINTTCYQAFQNTSPSYPVSVPSQLPEPLLHAPHAMPHPRMKSRAQRRAELKNHGQTSRVGHPHLSRPKETKESHARLVSRIKRQIGPALLLAAAPKDQKPAGKIPSYIALPTAHEPDWSLTTNMKAAMDWMQRGLSSLTDFSIGLPMADAAKPTKKFNGNIRVGQFIDELKNDFDIRKSRSLNPESSLKGVVIVIGENHYDYAMSNQIAKVIQYMRPDQHDLLMLEGDGEICKERTGLYDLPANLCVAIEDDFPTYVKSKKDMLLFADAVKEGAEFIHRINPQLPWEKLEKHTKGYHEFIRDHEHRLSVRERAQYKPLATKIRQLGDKVLANLEDSNEEREENMLKKIKEKTHSDAARFFILGQLHVQHLAPTLLQLPNVILMVPNLVTEDDRPFALPAKHNEL